MIKRTPDRAMSATQPYPRPSIEGGSASLDRKPVPLPKLSRQEISRIRQLLKKKAANREGGED